MLKLAFASVPHLIATLSGKKLRHVATALTNGVGGEWKQFNLASTWSRKGRFALYRYNDITFARPDMLRMMAETLSYPIFVIQVCTKPA